MKKAIRLFSLILAEILIIMPNVQIQVYAKPSTGFSSAVNSSDSEEFQDDSNDLTRSEVSDLLKEQPVEVDANTIVALYKSSKNEAKLNRKYNNKHVLITGKVDRVTDDADESGMTVYIDDDAGSSWIGIGCTFDSKKYEDIVADLDDGDYVEIDGVGEAGSFLYTVEHCQSIKEVSSQAGTAKAGQTDESAAEQTEQPEEEASNDEDVIKVDKTVYDQNNIKVRIKSIEPETFFGSLIDYQITFEIENNNAHEILATTEGFAVNGYMTDSTLYELISAGTKDKCDVNIYESDIEKSDSSDMSEFSFRMQIMDTDTYDTLADFTYKYDMADK